MRLLLLVAVLFCCVGCTDDGTTITKPDEFAPIAPEATAGAGDSGGGGEQAPPVAD